LVLASIFFNNSDIAIPSHVVQSAYWFRCGTEEKLEYTLFDG